MSSQIFTVTPVITTTAYAQHDVLGGVVRVPNAFDKERACKLVSLTVIDKENQKAALDILFFSEAPANSVGADNALYALNDADADKILARVSVAAADYVSSTTNSAEASLGNIQKMLQAKAGSKDLYVLVVDRDAAGKTYAAGALIVKLGLENR